MKADERDPPRESPSDATNEREAVALEQWQPGPPRKRFQRGKEKPRGVAWFGVRSFWGHLRHLAAVAIATEDVDSRFWMTPDHPRELMTRVSKRLAAGNAKDSVTENLERDLVIDYIADTGDDVAVSRAVARMLFAPYRLPDPDDPERTLVMPRGDVLFFGGDTAYPVATAEEITNRVLVPFNQVLEQLPCDRQRVLLGIPGNHDWYDGLDGFGRMFRQRDGGETHTDPPTSQQGTTLIGRYATFAREFVRGGQIEKPEALELIGYVPVQNASYFALPLAPGISMLAVDRQLRRVDHQQQDFFAHYLNNNLTLTPWVLLPDPIFAFGDRSSTGFEMLHALGLRLRGRPQFFLSGDIHHYRREHQGGSLFVTAGGGGAFLHPAAMRDTDLPADAEWPDRAQSRVLLRQVPIKVALGRSGILPHVACVVLQTPIVISGLHAETLSPGFWVTPLLVTVTVGFVLSLIGGTRETVKGPATLAAIAGVLIAALPIAGVIALRHVTEALPNPVYTWAAAAFLSFLCACFGVFIFGAYLALMTRFAWESTQAFTALDHPGFKHFVRFRVRKDGSAVDGYCIGMVDPLADDAKPFLIDRFTFRTSPAHRTRER